VGKTRHSTSRRFYVFIGKRNYNRRFGTHAFLHQRRVPAVKRVESVSDRMSYIVLTGRWSNIIVLKRTHQVRRKIRDT
jgi:hypothetical protein